MCPFVLRFPRILVLGLIAGWLSLPPAAAEGVSLSMKFLNHGQTAEVTVPKSAGKVALEFFDPNRGWQRSKVVRAVPGKLRFDLPFDDTIRWRVVFEPVRKFPAKFYAGKHSFPAVKSQRGPFHFLAGNAEFVGQTPGTTPPSAPVEADIWKIDGGTVYYFNQLRGLQVLDISDPADPRMTASLRLPAIGQDLYLLGESKAGRNLILLTSWYSDSGDEVTRINQVTVSGGHAEITAFKDVKGSLADSRLAGDRLLLATTRQIVDEKENWSSESRLSEWIVVPGKPLQADGETVLDGANPVISAGSDWLAVATSPTDRWNVSEVTVFALKPTGLIPLTSKPVRLAGLAGDSHKMQWSDNVLTTISEQNRDDGTWSPTAVLENFRVWGPDVISSQVVKTDPNPRLGRLVLGEGETLYATQFAGSRAYIVTFLQVDPLWIVDLSDPTAPVVAGHLDVPGWSTHLEPLGDLLFSIGWDSGAVVASLFDVADPGNPSLIRRLKVGNESEAAWEEKAIKFLPDVGLAMIPVTKNGKNSAAGVAGIQLLDLDIAGRDLRARGFIPHAFDTRRADLAGDSVVSISQRGLVTAGIADRDHPTVLAEVALAWPVDRVIDANKFLIHIEAGNSWSGGRPTARVTPADATEEVLTETDLRLGSVLCSELRGGRLFVVRQSAVSSDDGSADSSKLSLDLYDASALPALRLTGSCVKIVKGTPAISGGKILWPRPDRPAVVLDSPSWSIFWDAKPGLSLASSASIWPGWTPAEAPRLLVFDVSDPASPVVSDFLKLGEIGTTLTGSCTAADGLLAVGISEEDLRGATSSATRYGVRVVAFSGSNAPEVRPVIDLPGALFEATKLDRTGFLAFTRSFSGDRSAVQVSACDGFDAFLIDAVAVDTSAPVAASGMWLLVGTKRGVATHLLGTAGTFAGGLEFKTGWRPDFLRCSEGVVLATTWNRLFAADLSGASAAQWQFAAWSLSTDRIVIATDGDLLVPFGDYGAERLSR